MMVNIDSDSIVNLAALIVPCVYLIHFRELINEHTLIRILS